MPHRIFLLVVVFLANIVSHADADNFKLHATGETQWYRGNMHTHSLWSDGDDYPEMIAVWYKEQGYSFNVFTDHNVLLRGERWIDVEKNKGGKIAFDKLAAKFDSQWVQTRTEDGRLQVRLKNFDQIFDRLAVPQKFLLIQGEEITDGYRNMPVHMCVTNTTELLPPLHGKSIVEVMQQNINAAISRRERTGEKSLVHLNHPNFHYAITAEQLMQVIGENFFEVYNGHPTVNDSGDNTHPSTSRMWDIINTWRLAKLDLPLMYGLATDDGHAYHRTKPGDGAQPGRGWVMVLAKTLTPDALVSALEAGQFYSSSGVTLNSISVTNRSITLAVATEAETTHRIDFIGTRKGFDDTTSPATEDPQKSKRITLQYSDDVGVVLQSTTGGSAVYQFTGDELYVRAVVTSSRLHPNPSEPGDFQQAWIQPVVPNSP
ncbi:MAG: hypothetical protein P8K08_23720 [Fuerstiella sp.]|jgi:hypothetical protein|nr:hypothetical protein [Fuerstiella sp.]